MARLNKTRFALLGFLSIHPASGYEIKRMMEKSTDHFWREGDGSIYPILKQLLEEGMVNCELHNTDSDKPKKVYTLTLDGQRELQDWLFDEPAAFQARNELMLKVFFGWNVDSSVIQSHIKKFREQVTAKIKHLNIVMEKKLESGLEGKHLYQFLTMKAGMMYSEASIKWADETLELLNN